VLYVTDIVKMFYAFVGQI